MLVFTSYRTSKKRLLSKIRPFSRDEFSKIINPIIAQSRGIPLEKAKHQNYLQSNEVVAFLKEIGEPLEQYGKQVDLGGGGVNKMDLAAKLPYLSYKVLTAALWKIMAENRNTTQKAVSRKEIVRPKEVRALLIKIGEVGVPARPFRSVPLL
ncbi:hypothetical protein [Robiginitalea biformata]|uniref:Uncharacterized protein n=1 Tax=Robiginitalea biformata (strain ATCC BAA-864 / DSM 15991 / KCTC 12146 / HTCC2501) TaxID=313596 RepID=A4CKN0_ROBBH|nr:hypothetical protein [Robiginitalea biformata]EAR15429.1 hypothetical protein RB2501_13914 [Robiginitalea biformata HTCC2501]